MCCTNNANNEKDIRERQQLSLVANKNFTPDADLFKTKKAEPSQR